MSGHFFVVHHGRHSWRSGSKWGNVCTKSVPTCWKTLMSSPERGWSVMCCDAYLKAVRNVEFRRGDAHQIVHQHHDHDGDEHSKVADGGAHLHKTITTDEIRRSIFYCHISQRFLWTPELYLNHKDSEQSYTTTKTLCSLAGCVQAWLYNMCSHCLA